MASPPMPCLAKSCTDQAISPAHHRGAKDACFLLSSGRGRLLMVLRQRLLVSAIAMGLAAAQPASAAPWVRGYVVGAYEYAFRYGGRPDFSRGGEIEPGVDCPHGSSVHFASDDRTKVA